MQCFPRITAEVRHHKKKADEECAKIEYWQQQGLLNEINLG